MIGKMDKYVNKPKVEMSNTNSLLNMNQLIC